MDVVVVSKLAVHFNDIRNSEPFLGRHDSNVLLPYRRGLSA